MSPATPWTEMSVAATVYVKGVGTPIDDAVILYGVVMPIVGGFGWPDPTVAYTEMSVAATPYTEQSVAATGWTEFTL